MLNIKRQNRYELIYLSFSLDSLFKINLAGVRLHIGILFILFVLLFECIGSTRLYLIKGFLKNNWSLWVFTVYLLSIYFIGSKYPGAELLMVYYLLAIVVFYFFYKKEKKISDESIIYFQWLMIISGLLQFLLYQIWGYQLAFFDADHYLFEASFVSRLRGFFVEPNWYSITFTFNSLLLLSSLGKQILKHKILCFLTLCCFFFNGSYLGVLVIFLLLFVDQILSLKNMSKKRIKFIFLVLILVSGLLFTRMYFRPQSSTDVQNHQVSINYGSRFFPFVKTIVFMSSQNTKKQVFGYGLGSWPYIGLESNQLGYIGVSGEYNIRPAQRDSAEIHVFILEMGFLSLFFLFFDYAYNFFLFRRKEILFSIACGFLAASFFVYPVFKFLIYLAPFYILRSRAVKQKLSKLS